MILKELLNLMLNFFADDTMHFSIIKDPIASANDLNHDLDISSGLINGKRSLILTPQSRHLKLFSLVKR